MQIINRAQHQGTKTIKLHKQHHQTAVDTIAWDIIHDWSRPYHIRLHHTPQPPASRTLPRAESTMQNKPNACHHSLFTHIHTYTHCHIKWGTHMHAYNQRYLISVKAATTHTTSIASPIRRYTNRASVDHNCSKPHPNLVVLRLAVRLVPPPQIR